MNRVKYFIIAIIIAIFDIFTKFLAKSYFLNDEGYIIKEPIKIIGDYFRLNFVYNPGVAFGLPMGGRFILTTITIILVSVIAVVLYKTKDHRRLERAAYTLILGGALGNLYDRAFYGKVVDFFDSDFPNFIMERWPVFNVADSFVSIGMTLLLMQYLILDSVKKK